MWREGKNREEPDEDSSFQFLGKGQQTGNKKRKRKFKGKIINSVCGVLSLRLHWDCLRG